MEQNRYSPPTASLDRPPESLAPQDIDALEVSEAWKRRLKTIARTRSHPVGENAEFEARPLDAVNFLGFTLGPLYYAGKGMWRRAITLLFLSLACVFLLDVTYWLVSGGRSHIGGIAAYLIGGALFGLRANSDFYKKVVLRNNGWW